MILTTINKKNINKEILNAPIVLIFVGQALKQWNTKGYKTWPQLSGARQTVT